MRTIAIALVMLAGAVVSPVWAKDVPPVDLLPAPMFDGQADCGEPCKKYPTVLEEGKGGLPVDEWKRRRLEEPGTVTFDALQLSPKGKDWSRLDDVAGPLEPEIEVLPADHVPRLASPPKAPLQ